MSVTAERIAQLRKEKGLTQSEFAELIHSSRDTIANYENDRNKPTFAMLSLIAVALNTTVEYLQGSIDTTPPVSVANTTGERIRNLRKKCGFTQQGLADKINISRDTIVKYESNKVPHNLAMLSLIANALDTTVEYLYGYTDDAYKTLQNEPGNKVGIVALENSELALTLDGKVLPDEYRELFISFVRVLRKERDE